MSDELSTPTGRGWFRTLFDERLPRRIGWAQTLGSVVLGLLLLQAVTGLTLSLFYCPSPESAWESVRYVDGQVVLGAWLRGLHHWGASATVVALVLHMTQVFLWGGHKGRRRMTWWVGTTLFLVVLAFGFTGYLLPWDLKAYFGTKVGIHIAAGIPVVGPAQARLLQGGDAIGELTLTRFYAVHVLVLPLAVAGLVLWHLRLVRRHGASAPGVREGEPVTLGAPFFPRQALRDAVAVLGVTGLVGIIAWLYGAPLEGRADPTDTHYVPHPDWYFLGLQHLLRLFPVITATAVLPPAAVGLLYLAPILDRSPERLPSRRRLAIGLGLAYLACAVGLTLAGYFALERERAARAGATVAATTATTQPAVHAPSARGGALYEALRCASCHEAPDAGKGIDLPPVLRFAGNRFRREWLLEYLRNPAPIRWRQEGVRPEIRMPDFRLSIDEAGTLADHLMTLVDAATVPDTSIRWSEYSAEGESKGKTVYRQYACYGCHAIAGDGRSLGPDLTHVGAKLREDFMFRLVQHPQKVVPKTPMKDNDLWDEDAEALVRYLATLK